ncbi:hypothetical protein D9M69_717990 [compost metagenome]
MMVAPSSALAESDATNSAEYNRPQGMSAQATPSTTGARRPKEVSTGLALRQTVCPRPSIHAGWRACQISMAPSNNAPT